MCFEVGVSICLSFARPVLSMYSGRNENLLRLILFISVCLHADFFFASFSFCSFLLLSLSHIFLSFTASHFLTLSTFLLFIEHLNRWQ